MALVSSTMEVRLIWSFDWFKKIEFDNIGQATIKQSTSSIVDGINLEEIREFARSFKMRRLVLGLTQTQVGQALSATEGPAYSQSAICRSLTYIISYNYIW